MKQIEKTTHYLIHLGMVRYAANLQHTFFFLYLKILKSYDGNNILPRFHNIKTF
jgi:hypothetical protein